MLASKLLMLLTGAPATYHDWPDAADPSARPLPSVSAVSPKSSALTNRKRHRQRQIRRRQPIRHLQLADAGSRFRCPVGDAHELGIASLEDYALKLAVAGSEKMMMFILAANRPDKYRPQSTRKVTTTTNAATGTPPRDLRRQPLHELRAELAALTAQAVISDQAGADPADPGTPPCVAV
jgi:hypothetical protein